jgi:hypothetical protein
MLCSERCSVSRMMVIVFVAHGTYFGTVIEQVCVEGGRVGRGGGVRGRGTLQFFAVQFPAGFNTKEGHSVC